MAIVQAGERRQGGRRAVKKATRCTYSCFQFFTVERHEVVTESSRAHTRSPAQLGTHHPPLLGLQRDKSSSSFRCDGRRKAIRLKWTRIILLSVVRLSHYARNVKVAKGPELWDIPVVPDFLEEKIGASRIWQAVQRDPGNPSSKSCTSRRR